MNIVITSRQTPGYLLVNSEGNVKDEAELKEHCQLVFDEILKHDNKKILINEPGTSVPKDIIIYYNLVTYYVNNFPPKIRSLKIAVVLSEEFKEMGDFWETVCVNQGLQYFVFTTFQEAHDWLIK